MTRPLDQSEVTAALAALPGWRGDTTAIRRDYTFPAFDVGVSAVDLVAVEADTMDHHPDIDIRWRTVTFALSTHSAGGVTSLDVELAHRTHTIATDLGGV